MKWESSFQTKLAGLLEQLSAMRENYGIKILLFHTDSDNTLCEIISPNTKKDESKKYKEMAYHLFRGDKSVCIINNKINQMLNSLKDCNCFALEHSTNRCIVFVLAKKATAQKCAEKTKLLLLQLFYEDICEQASVLQNKFIKVEKRANSYAHLSHEFKTPLNIIQTSVQLLKIKIKKDNEKSFSSSYEQLFTFTEDSVFKLSRLTSNLLDCARAESGAMELVLSYESFVDCVKGAVAQIATFAMEHNIKIMLKNKCNILENYLFDTNKIEKVVLNLLSNAIVAIDEASRENGKIGITLKEDNRFLYIVVRDNGKGINKEDSNKIFDTFYTSNKCGGTGLGLTVVRAMAELHDGWIKSIAVKEGAKFVVALSKSASECKGDNIYSKSSHYCLYQNTDFAAQEIASIRARIGTE